MSFLILKKKYDRCNVYISTCSTDVYFTEKREGNCPERKYKNQMPT